ncbi:MAG: hypothetical protein COB20_13830, partial [SAR86 cluster bacterium]
MSSRLRVGISGLILLFGAVSATLLTSEFHPAQGATEDQQTFAANDMQQLVNSYCLACHNNTLATADFSLQNVDFAKPALHADALERVVKKLRAHMMPPAGMPRPEFETYQLMTDWLERELDNAWAANPNPGRVTPLHRMNRYEYNNTINALLGLDVDVMNSLPGDPTADGSFDNMAASLPFSTAHMERYMSVARQVTRLATGLPPLGPTTTTYEVPLFMKQNQRQSNDMPFGSRGGVSVNHNFPASGEYQFRVHLERNYQDYIKGLGWPQQLEIRLNGRLLERFTIGGEAPGTPAPLSFSGTGEPGTIDWEQYMLTEAGEGLEVRLPVEAGPAQISVSYIRQLIEPESIPQPVQGGRLYANDEAYLDYQKIYALEVSGPFQASQPVFSQANSNESPSQQKIFSCHPDRGAEELSCATEILSTLARRAYRRPAGDQDLDLLLGFYSQGRETGGDFNSGIQFALEFMLSDPDFLIRSYSDPADSATGETFPLSDLELASRLAFFLWSTAPDEQLLNLAEQNQLSNPEVLEQQVRRMLADTRGVTTLVEDFAAQWLNLRRLDEVQVNTVVFPNYDLSLIEGFRQETQ